MKNFELQCGRFRYEVTPEVKKVLESTIYWSNCLWKDREELDRAESRGSTYSDEEIEKLRRAVEEENASLCENMDRMERLGIPNWVGNGAIAYGRDTDFTSHYLSDFFYESIYAVKARQNSEEQETVAEEKEEENDCLEL